MVNHVLGEMMATPPGGQSFLELVHHPNLRLFVSAGFHIGHHRGLSHGRPINVMHYRSKEPRIKSV